MQQKFVRRGKAPKSVWTGGGKWVTWIMLRVVFSKLLTLPCVVFLLVFGSVVTSYVLARGIVIHDDVQNRLIGTGLRFVCEVAETIFAFGPASILLGFGVGLVAARLACSIAPLDHSH